MIKRIGSYENGNYRVFIYEDGTKVRANNLDFFESSFPENIDIKISNQCDIGCPMCHEKSTPDGANADLSSLTFINSLRPHTELAIGGGNVFANPQFLPFLLVLRGKQIIANITVNQKHFEQNFGLIKYLIDEKLVYGIGVSLVDPTDLFIKQVKECGSNVVIHVINGVVTEEQISALSNHQLKILFLGYKNFGRGLSYFAREAKSIATNQNWIYHNLGNIIKSFKVVSFDNLAIEQLEPKRFLTEEQYSHFYMGDEGEFTMYIDAVNRTFAQNSIATTRYELKDTIDEMFTTVKNNRT